MNLEKVKQELSHLTMADHVGDMNDSLPGLCRALDLPEPKWSGRYEHYVMAWDEDEFYQDLRDDGEEPEEDELEEWQ